MFEPAASKPESILASNVQTPEQEAAPYTAIYASMLRELRSWGMWQIRLGAVNAATGNPPWGILAIAVGLSSFWLRSPAMFVVYTLTLAFAGISNLSTVTSTGASVWLGLGLLQLYFAYNVYRQFRRFAPAHEAFVAAGVEDRAARVFPPAAALLGLTGAVGLVLAVSSLASGSPPQLLTDLVEGLILDAAILGFALGVASLLSRYPLLARCPGPDKRRPRSDGFCSGDVRLTIPRCARSSSDLREVRGSNVPSGFYALASARNQPRSIAVRRR